MKHYLVYSIGPVQSFIASARKTEDLWSGSHLLAELSKQAMRVYAPFVTTWVQPGSRPKELSDVADVPNRFSVILEADAKKIIELSKRPKGDYQLFTENWGNITRNAVSISSSRYI